MLNKVTIMGRLCAAPELRRTQKGIAVCNARIAVERDYVDPCGERETDFFDIVAWRGTAEFLCGYFGKGRRVVLDGRLQTRSWTDREGNKRRSAEVVANNVYFGDSRPKEDQGSQGAPAPYGGGAGDLPEGFNPFAEIGEEDGELPF